MGILTLLLHTYGEKIILIYRGKFEKYQPFLPALVNVNTHFVIMAPELFTHRACILFYVLVWIKQVFHDESE